MELLDRQQQYLHRKLIILFLFIFLYYLLYFINQYCFSFSLSSVFCTLLGHKLVYKTKMWHFFFLQTNVLGAEVDLDDTVFNVRYECNEGQEMVQLGDDDEGSPTYVCGMFSRD